MWNVIPVLGWLVSLIVNVSLALPFWLCWTVFGVGQKFFYFMPPVYQRIGFWDTVFLFTVVGIVKLFVPSLASVSTTNSSEKKAGAK